MVLLVRRAVGRDGEGVGDAQRQHQQTDQPVQGQLAPQSAAHPEKDHRQRYGSYKPEISGQKAADLPVGNQQRQGAVDLAAVQQGILLPKRRAVRVADTQPALPLIVGGQGHGIAAPGGALHHPVQAKAGVLPRKDACHIAGALGQYLAGGGVGQRQFQCAGGLFALHAENKGHGDQVIVKRKGLAGTGLHRGVNRVIIADTLRQGFASLAAHSGEPGQHKNGKAHRRCHKSRDGVLMLLKGLFPSVS